MVVSFVYVSGLAYRALHARPRSSHSRAERSAAQRSETGQPENWGQTVGGTNFLVYRPGGCFIVHVIKAISGGGPKGRDRPVGCYQTKLAASRCNRIAIARLRSG